MIYRNEGNIVKLFLPIAALFHGQTFADTWCKGLRAVAHLKGLRRRIIVYPEGPVLRTTDGIDVFPFQHFADQLDANSL
jgi:hypothetical protein